MLHKCVITVRTRQKSWFCFQEDGLLTINSMSGCQCTEFTSKHDYGMGGREVGIHGCWQQTTSVGSLVCIGCCSCTSSCRCMNQFQGVYQCLSDQTSCQPNDNWVKHQNCHFELPWDDFTHASNSSRIYQLPHVWWMAVVGILLINIEPVKFIDVMAAAYLYLFSQWFIIFYEGIRIACSPYR